MTEQLNGSGGLPIRYLDTTVIRRNRICQASELIDRRLAEEELRLLVSSDGNPTVVEALSVQQQILRGFCRVCPKLDVSFAGDNVDLTCDSRNPLETSSCPTANRRQA